MITNTFDINNVDLFQAVMNKMKCTARRTKQLVEPQKGEMRNNHKFKQLAETVNT